MNEGIITNYPQKNISQISSSQSSVLLVRIGLRESLHSHAWKLSLYLSSLSCRILSVSSCISHHMYNPSFHPLSRVPHFCQKLNIPKPPPNKRKESSYSSRIRPSRRSHILFIHLALPRLTGWVQAQPASAAGIHVPRIEAN